MRAEDHLTLEDCLRAYLLPEEREAYRPHLEQCPQCAAALQRMQREMRSDSDRFHREAEAMPEHFWERQRHRILLQTEGARPKATPVWKLFDLKVWATAAAVLLFSTALMQWSPQPVGPRGLSDLRISEADKRDDSFLIDVNEAILQDSADPLRPLELLVEIPDDTGKIAVDLEPNDNS